MTLVAAAAAHLLGTQRAWAQAGHGRLVGARQPWWFASGLVVTAVALVSPLHAAAHHNLAAHMVQHVLLIAVAAPLLVAGAPFPAVLWCLPEGTRKRAMHRWRRIVQSQRGRGRSHWLVLATVVQIVVLSAWHLPDLYEAAVRNDAIHAVEHMCFLGTACGFWWATGLGPVAVRGEAVLAVFVTSLAGTALGAALLLAPEPLYSSYPSLSDQQVGAVIMWVFPGVEYVLAGVVLFAKWVSGSDRRAGMAVAGRGTS